MSRQTTNYGYNISEGTDLVNPLVDIFPNWESLDGDLKDVSDDAVGRATELTTGTVHALTRSDVDRDVFVFTATSNFTAGDTFTLDGTQVSALTPAGEQLATGCYIIGSDVLVAVHETLLTMYVSPTKVADSDKLDGHDSTYFATASDVSDLSDDLDAVSNKVGTGVLTTTAQDCVGGINELHGDLIVNSVTGIDWSDCPINSGAIEVKQYGKIVDVHFTDVVFGSTTARTIKNLPKCVMAYNGTLLQADVNKGYIFANVGATEVGIVPLDASAHCYGNIIYLCE